MKRKKTSRSPRATDGGSKVALAARFRPGGTHDRRKTPRAVDKRNAIKEASE